MKHYADEYDEPRRKRYINCSDRMCGAEDCKICHPENFQDVEHIRDISEQSEWPDSET